MKIIKRISNKLKRVIKRVLTYLPREHGIQGLSSRRVNHLHKQATSLGLFNFEWYKKYYGDFPSSLVAFEDYLDKSTYSNVNPSYNFDTEFYHRTSPDIYHKGLPPLAHFLLHGKYEGRLVSGMNPTWRPKSDVHPKTNSKLQSKKIAICLHIYYSDFIEKFYESLVNFPLEFDVFVALKDSTKQGHLLNTFTKLKNCRNIEVTIAPNKGRNFGPLLVEFSDKLLSYDLMCHLHSKKSLYSGKEQTQWSDYLNQFLLKDKHVTAMALRHFEENPKLGMFYPTSFFMMPSWVNHWTCNKPFATEFVDKWELDISNDFLNYPVGGMFWAKPAAIKDMLEGKYTYEDFPDEPLPNDGSWLHALERALGCLPKKNGYDTLFYHPPTGKFTQDNSFIYTGYTKPLVSVNSDLSNFDILSFDIFDTIARREFYYPDYAKMKMKKWLVEQGHWDLSADFVAKRNEAEFLVRKDKSFVGDVDIFETYNKLAETFGWSTEQAYDFANIEFELDLAMMQPKHEMVDLVNELCDSGKEILFVTDIYYTASQIETLLKKIGVVAQYKLYVSTDIQMRKDSGAVWAFLKDQIAEKNNEQKYKAEKAKKLLKIANAELKVKKKELTSSEQEGDESYQALLTTIINLEKQSVKESLSFLHIGDNVRSDAQLCGDFGFQTMHILNPYDKWLAAGFENVFIGEVTEKTILKWGPLVSSFGRYPYLGE